MTENPNKYIRKEIFNRVSGMVIGGITFKVFDSVGYITSEKAYVVVMSQLNQPLNTKCNKGWINNTEIHIIYKSDKKQGSRLGIDDAVQELLNRLDNFSITDTEVTCSRSEIYMDEDTVEETDSEIIYRKVVRLETIIN